MGDHLGGLLLLRDQRDQVVRGPPVEPGGGGPGDALLAGHRSDLAGEGADGGTELGGASEGVAGPERQAPGLARRGGDEHPVVGDVLDAPARRAEGEDVTDPGLVDHLLVELAHPGGLLTDQEDAEQPAVGDRAAARHREALGARTAGELAGDPVPHQARSQLGELVAGVATGEEVQRRVVRAAREGGEGRGPSYDVEELVRLPGVHRGGCHHLLGEYIERAGRHVQRLDAARPHPFHRHRGGHEIATVLGEENTTRHLADLVARAADPLQRAGHRRRRLDLDDEVDSTHVDAELEAAGRDDARKPTPLEVVLDDRPLLLGDRPVVGACDEWGRTVSDSTLTRHLGRGARASHPLRSFAAPRGPVPSTTRAPLRSRRARLSCLEPLPSQPVEAGGQALGEASGVGEDDGRPVLLDQVEHAALDVGPQ